MLLKETGADVFVYDKQLAMQEFREAVEASDVVLAIEDAVSSSTR